jgi:hypothetical protein
VCGLALLKHYHHAIERYVFLVNDASSIRDIASFSGGLTNDVAAHIQCCALPTTNAAVASIPKPSSWLMILLDLDWQDQQQQCDGVLLE